MTGSTDQPLLQVENLTVRFPMPKTSLFAPRQYLEAVRDVSFDLPQGRTLGIVGESGSGKTTTAMAAVRLTGPATGAGRPHVR